MASSIVIFWRDLRLSDHPALLDAVTRGAVVPVFFSNQLADLGAARQAWLEKSLTALQSDLTALGSPLLFIDDQPSALAAFARQHNIPLYLTDTVDRFGQAFAETLNEAKLYRYLPNLLTSTDVRNKQGGAFKVFTPFWKAALAQVSARSPLSAPVLIADDPALRQRLRQSLTTSEQVPSLRSPLGWDSAFFQHATPGEVGAQQRLADFLEATVQRYDRQRDLPAESATSRLSPHLGFGEISIHTLVHRLLSQGYRWDFDNVWLRELGWREFSHYQLTLHPRLDNEPLQEKFQYFPWQADDRLLRAWQHGRTGIPLVDAGMRQLWQTGWMHNRVRMVVGSLLVKNLLQPWQAGRAWFDDTLVDSAPAPNWASWQWIAGCGADAAPYFRIFNPVTQSERFDAQADYIKRWCPELSKLPSKLAHAPWQRGVADYGVELGKDYPRPLVDLKDSRQAALAAFQQLKAAD